MRQDFNTSSQVHGDSMKLFSRVGALALASLLSSSGAALAAAGNPECVHDAGKQACASHVSNPITGEQVWTLWNDTWRQELRWSTTNGLHLTDLTHWLDAAHSQSVSWAPSGLSHRQKLYEVQLKANSTAALETFAGPSTADGFVYTTSQLASDASGYVELCVNLEKHRAPSIVLPELHLELALHFRCYANGSLETQAELTNLAGATATIHHVSSLCMRFERPGGNGGEGWSVRSLAGTRMRDTFNCTTAPFEIASSGWFGIYERSGGSTSDGFTGGFVMPNLANTRPFTLRLTHVDGVEVLEAKAFALQKHGQASILVPLPAGVRYVAPAFYGGFFTSPAMRAMAQVHQNYQLRRLRPQLPATFPPVTYNNYFVDFNDFDRDVLWDEAQQARSIGAETFVIDAGWNHATAREDDGFHFGLGYWFGSNCKFPDAGANDGFTALLDDMRGIGLTPGVWMYTPRVDLTLNQLANASELPCWYQTPRPADCFCAGPGDPSCSPWSPGMLTQQASNVDPCPVDDSCWVACDAAIGQGRTGWICAAHSAGFAWLEAMLTHVFDDYGLGYLVPEGGAMPYDCTRHSIHADHVRDGGAGLVVDTELEAMYRLYDELRANFPQAVLEAEWPMGHFAIFEDPFVPDDVDPRDSRLQAESLRWFTLANYTGNYLYGPPTPAMVPPESPSAEAYWPYWIRSRMLGSFNLSSDIAGWPQGFAHAVTEHASYFSTHRRFQRGPSFNLISQAQWDESTGSENPAQVQCECLSESNCDAGPATWDAVEFLDESQDEALVFAFRNLSQHASVTLRLEGLDPTALYGVYRFGESTPSSNVCGAVLMNTGYSLTLNSPWTSEVLRFEKSGSACGF